MPDIKSEFDSLFEIIPANDKKLLLYSQALRFEVFCREQGFFDSNLDTKDLEIDPFDKWSAHSLLRHRSSGIYAATVRIVLPRNKRTSTSYPIEAHFKMLNKKDGEIIANLSQSQLAEVSRFAVAKNFRRRSGEDKTSHGISTTFEKTGSQSTYRRTDSHITLGLIHALLKMSQQHNITHWLAFMEPGLIRLLSRIGIHFKRIGPAIKHYGMRYICYIKLQDMLNDVAEEKPEIWAFLSNHGKLSFDEVNPEQAKGQFLSGKSAP
ncbi:MAG: PEP-CTERM/exosortase system-associated acyltransferase [Gammaproteobacteria bacterium]|nr:PEP-CTERM/exosortase system-associated acyltransferase [Gammaproteobacteria bacterium]